MLCELFVKILSSADLRDAVGIAWLGSKKFVGSDQLCHVDQLARII
jgi:hypothetical protein